MEVSGLGGTGEAQPGSGVQTCCVTVIVFDVATQPAQVTTT